MPNAALHPGNNCAITVRENAIPNDAASGKATCSFSPSLKKPVLVNPWTKIVGEGTVGGIKCREVSVSVFGFRSFGV